MPVQGSPPPADAHPHDRDERPGHLRELQRKFAGVKCIDPLDGSTIPSLTDLRYESLELGGDLLPLPPRHVPAVGTTAAAGASRAPPRR